LGHSNNCVSEERFPAIFIYVLREERIEIEKGDPGLCQRDLTIVVESWAFGTDSETTLDSIAEEIENAIYADRSLNNLALDTNLARTEFIQTDEHEQNYLIARFTFIVQFYTANDSATD